MKKRGKKGQFYLVAAIIIVGIVIALSVILNYSSKTNSYGTEEIAKELTIEGEKVIDYDEFNNGDFTEIYDFSNQYSYYVGEDTDIYFILVDKINGFEDAYMYTQGQKVDLRSDLVVNEDVIFRYDNINYNFKLEEGKGFYFIVVYEKGGDRYVFTG